MPTTTNQQIVNVSINPEKKRRRRKKGGLPKKKTGIGRGLELPVRPIQPSAFNTSMSPNRPYIPYTSYISSPYNNGVVPDVYATRDISQETMQNIMKTIKQQSEWEDSMMRAVQKANTPLIEEVVSKMSSVLGGSHYAPSVSSKPGRKEGLDAHRISEADETEELPSSEGEFLMDLGQRTKDGLLIRRKF
jgi:hypothetical protein